MATISELIKTWHQDAADQGDLDTQVRHTDDTETAKARAKLYAYGKIFNVLEKYKGRHNRDIAQALQAMAVWHTAHTSTSRTSAAGQTYRDTWQDLMSAAHHDFVRADDYR